MTAGKKAGQDSLMVQVALKIKAPPNVRISKKILQKILDMMVNGEELPKNVTVDGIFWRNPNRRGSLGFWRWHDGANLDNAPEPLEDEPREPDWQATIPSLGAFLLSGNVTFR